MSAIRVNHSVVHSVINAMNNHSTDLLGSGRVWVIHGGVET
jgi:hypothetical protein